MNQRAGHFYIKSCCFPFAHCKAGEWIFVLPRLAIVCIVNPCEPGVRLAGDMGHCICIACLCCIQSRTV